MEGRVELEERRWGWGLIKIFYQWDAAFLLSLERGNIILSWRRRPNKKSKTARWISAGMYRDRLFAASEKSCFQWGPTSRILEINLGRPRGPSQPSGDPGGAFLRAAHHTAAQWGRINRKTPERKFAKNRVRRKFTKRAGPLGRQTRRKPQWWTVVYKSGA